MTFLLLRGWLRGSFGMCTVEVRFFATHANQCPRPGNEETTAALDVCPSAGTLQVDRTRVTPRQNFRENELYAMLHQDASV